MRVFVTGASGHIASAVISELLRNGHEVVGLARSDASAEAVAALGAGVHRGDLADIAGLKAAASEADGVIHLGYDHESMRTGDMATAVEKDLAVVKAFGETLSGTDKPFVGTSGTLMLTALGLDRVGTEDDFAASGPRIDAENYVVGLAQRRVRSSVVRLAPMCHSDLDHHGFTHVLINCAREHGVAVYIGDGTNRWPAANTYDIGVLYRLALEEAPAGSRLHGTGDNGIPFTTIAETIAGKLGIETKSVTTDEVGQYLGFLSPFAGLDNPVSNEKTRHVLGWEPTHPGWVEDVQSGSYFAA